MTRRHDAQRPIEIPGSGWNDVPWRVKAELTNDYVGLIAAGVAFYWFSRYFKR